MKLETVQALFPEATERRGKIWLHDMDVARILNGVPISFTRRRYGGGDGGTTYTWAEAFIDGLWIALGDPWPCINPPTAALQKMIDFFKTCPHAEQRERQNDPAHPTECARCYRPFPPAAPVTEPAPAKGTAS